MSSLWTPGGEVPIERDPDRGAPAGATDQRADPPPPTDPGGPEPTVDEAEYARLRDQLLEVPAGEVIAQHAMGFYELAALHLSQPEPRLQEARVAIDALSAVLTSLEGRLGAAEEPLSAALPQLRMAFVEASDRTSDPPEHAD